MKVKLHKGVRYREDAFFGGICYVPHRDDFFAATREILAIIVALTPEFAEAQSELVPAYTALAELGICDTCDPKVQEKAYSGPSFLGPFLEIPTVRYPLVLNCFCTAHCPLKCIYCHADDLMYNPLIDIRGQEAEPDLDSVIRTAKAVPSIVAVITGGDPLTRPQRAKHLIEALSGQKALVLDTSGVGDIDPLLDSLASCNVHVRVSLDAVSSVNDTVRPINREYVKRDVLSRDAALDTIRKCIGAGISVSVQTVISARNENPDEWIALRESLLRNGVHNWVMHVAIKAGKARAIEERVNLRPSKRGTILPSINVYDKLGRFIKETSAAGYPLDIRCTDTNLTPNSVLLIDNVGNLYTEGYAHKGKMLLFRADEGRPDLINALWPQIDRFGHARRYLNWNPWFFERESLESVCYKVPLPAKNCSAEGSNLVEAEAKFYVKDVKLLSVLLEKNGYTSGPNTIQRDEYFDTGDRILTGLDFNIRVRDEGSATKVAVKGPRFYRNDNSYFRLELEFIAESSESVKADLEKHGLQRFWFLEKRRITYRKEGDFPVVVLDELPEIGVFVEFEGRAIQKTVQLARDALGPAARSNYGELFLAFKEGQGCRRDEICGAEFEKGQGTNE